MAAPDDPPNPPVGDTAIRLSDVGVRYRSGRHGSVQALAAVSLLVAPGEIVAVCGRNGAGKTTLLDVVTGFVAPGTGAVRVLGTDPRQATAGQRARVGVALADTGLPPAATPRRLLNHLRLLHRVPTPLDDIAERLALTPLLGRRIRRLSTGERQRVAVACALIGRPAVLVLDEPTSALDVDGRGAVLRLLGELRDAGCAVLWTSHTLTDVGRASDRVVVLDHGRVVAAAAPSDLMGAVDVVRFEAGAARDTSLLQAALPTRMSIREASAGKYEVAGEGVDAEVLATVSTWQAANGGAGRLSVGPRELEDVVAALGAAGRHELTGRPRP